MVEPAQQLKVDKNFPNPKYIWRLLEVIPNYGQQDTMFLDLFISKDAVRK